MRCHFILGICFFLVAVQAGAADRPNILWITAEDHGPHMGCYGDALAVTPNVDALAAKGIRYRFCWSNAPVCAAARSVLILGVHGPAAGSEHMRSQVPMPSAMQMYPQLLRAAGYYCTNNEKEDYNFAKPSTVWDASSKTAHYRDRATDQPFFAIFNTTVSHESRVRHRPHEAICDPKQVRVPAYHPDTPEVRQDWAQYYDVVSQADAYAGERLAELEREGLAEDTIVFYYADHGSGMPRSKRWPGNSGLHVPLVTYYPKKWQHLAPENQAPGSVAERLVSFVDLPPTLLSLAGIQPPAWMQGHAFAGSYAVDGPKFVFGYRGRMDECADCVRTISDGRYVYIRNFMPHLSAAQKVIYQFETPTTAVWHDLFLQAKTNPAQSAFWSAPKPVEELYDLATDPDETINLATASDQQERLQTFRAELLSWQAEMVDVGLVPEAQMHALCGKKSPYDWAREPEQTAHWADLLQTADWASREPDARQEELIARLQHPHPSVRYWAAMAWRMHSSPLSNAVIQALQATLRDGDPMVRLAASAALAQWTEKEILAEAEAVLLDLANSKTHGHLQALATVSAIERLTPPRRALLEQVLTLPQAANGPARMDKYLPNLIQRLNAERATP